jgi:hypothetical protein
MLCGQDEVGVNYVLALRRPEECADLMWLFRSRRQHVAAAQEPSKLRVPA